jgi:hypothetical protein
LGNYKKQNPPSWRVFVDIALLFNTMSAKTLRTITLIGHGRFGGYGVDQYVLLVHSVIIYDRVKKVKDFLAFFTILAK